MTVSTEYFDYVFEAREEVAEELEWSERKLARLERKQSRLERMIENKPSAKKLRRLDKVTGLIDTFEEDVELLSEELEDLNAVELPKDEVSFSFWNPVDGFTGVQVTITDSPYDDSFVGGEGNKYKIVGSGKLTERGRSSFATTLGIDASFADGTQTFGFADRGNQFDGSYPSITAEIIGPGTSNFYTVMLPEVVA